MSGFTIQARRHFYVRTSDDERHLLNALTLEDAITEAAEGRWCGDEWPPADQTVDIVDGSDTVLATSIDVVGVGA